MEERLVYLRSVVRCGSFSEAARQLHVSQPALSTAIAKLERELKTTLVDRSSSPARATEAGLMAIRTADAMQRERDGLRAELDRLAERRPRLRFGLIDSVAALYSTHPTYLPDLIRRYRAHLHVDASRPLLKLLYAGELDAVAAVSTNKTAPAGYVHAQVGEEPLVLVSAPGLSNTRAKRLISYPADSLTAQAVVDTLNRWHLSLTPHTYSSSPEVMYNLVQRRLGVAALPFYLVEAGLRRGELVVIRPSSDYTPLITRPITLYAAAYEPIAMTLLTQQIQDTLSTTQAKAGKLVYYKKSL